jgi:hypothetical protein
LLASQRPSLPALQDRFLFPHDFESKDTYIFSEFLTKQEVAETFERSVFSAIELCFEIIPADIGYHAPILHPFGSPRDMDRNVIECSKA